jgi:hypothetical protein
LVSAIILGLYVLTIAPTTQFWDTSEYMAAARVLGIPHPPGNPLFVILANVWGRIPLVAHYALRINLFAAVTSACASGFLFLCVERFLQPLVSVHRNLRYLVAFAGVFVGATSFTVWNQSVVNEKVYTLSLLSIALLLWLGLRWADREQGPGRDQLLILILYLLALTSTNHSMGLLAAPGMMVLGYLTLRQEKAATAEWAKGLVFCTMALAFLFLPTVLEKGAQHWIYYLLTLAVLAVPLAITVNTGQHRFAAFALIAVSFGLSLNLFLPIRAGLFPPINEGEPTNWEALRQVLTRFQYQKSSLIPRQAELTWQYVNYLQYFAWQFGRSWESAVRYGLAGLFGGLGLVGAGWHWLRDRRHAATMAVLMLTVTVALVFYLDFKYGFSIRLAENLPREVRERDYFFIASFQLWGVWVALGFAAIAQLFSSSSEQAAQERKRWLATIPVLSLAVVPLAGNWLSASRSDETLPRDVAWDMLQSVEPYGILITVGDNDTFPLWYMQEVEGVRRDVTLANLSLLNTRWHTRQIKRREVAAFDTANAIPLYRGRSWSPPTEQPLSLSFTELDELPPYYRVPENQVFQAGQIRAELPEYLERADIVTLRLIQDNLGERPIYIARTTGNYGERMGLAPYLVGQGLVGKLMPQPVQPSDSMVYVQTLGWMDLATSQTLLFDVYHPESAARQRPFGWIDTPSESIITLYAVVYASFAEAMSVQGVDSTGVVSDSTVAAHISQANDWANRMLGNTSYGR